MLSITKEILRQIKPEDKAVVETIISILAVVTVTASTWSIVTNTILQTSLNKLVSFVINMQIIMTMMLINIFCTAHAELYKNYLLEIVNFEVFDYSSILVEYLSIPVVESEAFNPHFEASGYESSDSIANMGPFFVILLIGPLIVILLLLIRLCISFRYC